MDRVNYRPYYHERLGEQIHRKNRLARNFVEQTINKSKDNALEQNEASVNS